MERREESKGQLVVEDNTIYEIDLECVRCQKENERLAHESDEKKQK